LIVGAASLVPLDAVAGNTTYDYTFEFVNGLTLTGSSPDKTTLLTDAGGSSVDDPTGMEVHLSCSDSFPGGFGKKDGPVAGVDTAWQIESYSINKVKDGKIDKTCSGEDLPSLPPSGKFSMYSFTFVNGITIEGMSENNTAFLADAGGPSVQNPTGMDVHVSCSDKFPGGFGAKDGPVAGVDTAWQIESYSIKKVKDGKVDKTCGDDFGPPPPVGVPAIDIEKSVNGVDADDPPGPEVNVGDTVTFGYVVTNTGEVPLRDVAVVDNTLGPISCPMSTLDIGASMMCGETTEVVTEPGPQFMDATVTAVGSTGAPGITDPPPPTGKGRQYSFTFVNGTTLAGVAPDDNTYFLAGAGGTSVENPTGMDVHLSCSDEFSGGWGEKDGPVAGVDAAWQIAAWEIVKFKDGRVDKRCGDQFAPVDQTVSDTDPVNYTAVVAENPSIDIEKAVNGEDADNPPGPTVNVGDTVTFSYQVTNTGDTVLDNIEVIDSTLGPITCPTTSLDPGDTTDCGPTTETASSPGPQYMDAKVTGTSPSGTVVMDDDPVNYKVIAKTNPSIDIEKDIDGHDADSPPGPTYPLWEWVTFSYTVTNTGDTVLRRISVVDSVFGEIWCPKTKLQPGQTMHCEPMEMKTTHEGQNFMKSTVTAKAPGGIPVGDVDPVYFLVLGDKH
jgi:hypothetical protein